MIINIGENKVSCKQTSNGFWYVNDISISGISVIDNIELMDRSIEKIAGVLKKYNNGKNIQKKSG